MTRKVDFAESVLGALRGHEADWRGKREALEEAVREYVAGRWTEDDLFRIASDLSPFARDTAKPESGE